MKKILFLLVVSCASMSFADGPVQPLQDIQYRRSIEFQAIATEVYRYALDTVSSERKGLSSPFALVLDVDETVLDNTQYQVETNDVYNDAAWAAWISRREAGLVPGSKEFLDHVRLLSGVHIIFITDRNDSQKADTLVNLQNLGVYKAGDLLLTKQNSGDNKSVRRQCVEQALDSRCRSEGPLPILALFGDSARDFEERHGDDMNTMGRQSIVSQAGSKYFVIPNPMYGQWQSSYK